MMMFLCACFAKRSGHVPQNISNDTGDVAITADGDTGIQDDTVSCLQAYCKGNRVVTCEGNVQEDCALSEHRVCVDDGGTSPARCARLLPSNGIDLDQLNAPIARVLNNATTLDTNQSTPNSKLIQVNVEGTAFSYRVYHYSQFEITRTGRLRVIGDFPAIFVVDGEVIIDGLLELGGSDDRPGAGGGAGGSGLGATPEDRAGKVVVNGSVRASGGMGGPPQHNDGSVGDPGGAGGSFGTKGGDGGRCAPRVSANDCVDGPSTWTPTASGPRGNNRLVPLFGGAGGGAGGDDGDGSSNGQGDGGHAGGAIQVTSLTKITIGISGKINASGAGGVGGNWGSLRNSSGGGGGGSGGAVLLEAPEIQIDGRVGAYGGSGGQGAQCEPRGRERYCDLFERSETYGTSGEDGNESRAGMRTITDTGTQGMRIPEGTDHMAFGGYGGAGGSNLDAEHGQDGTNGGGGGGGAGRIAIMTFRRTGTGTLGPNPFVGTPDFTE